MPDQPPNAGNPPAADKKPNGSPIAGLIVPGLLILAAGAVFAVFYFLNQKQPPVDPVKLLNGYVVNAEKFAKLSDEYRDADGDLVADTPADAKEPAELYFTEIPGPNPDRDEETWKAFLEHMSKHTGKPCKYLKKVDLPPGPPATPDEADGVEAGEPAAEAGTVRSFDAQLSALKGGKLHITAFTTGQVRQAVNTAGFRPLVVPADQAGKFTYQIQVLVPAGSKAEKVSDLKGKKLAVAALSSNSGAKAPFVAFHDEFKLFPARDFTVVPTGRYEAALGQLVQGKVDATCIASDLLARELTRPEPTADEKKRGWVKLTEDKYRVLHTFGDFPKLCFGVSHTLPPDLVKKIQKGFDEFRFEGTAVGEKYKGDAAVKFQPIDYKKDWEAVRKVDDRLVDIINGK